MLRKLHTSLLALSALAMVTSPVNAATITSPADGTPITATGIVVVNYFGFLNFNCTINMSGHVESASANRLAFTSGTSSCGSDLAVPMNFDVVSSTLVSTTIIMNVPPNLPPCLPTNVLLNFAIDTMSTPATSTIKLGSPQSFSPCTLRAVNLTVTPAVTII
ncbi:hypothetical protein [Sphingopyxis sp. R3-92]|uniref:hypothetical protein n=1 Tax=Sphingopyxis sp. R3-92 TaxID=3158553 RepID=UPI003EE4B75A